MQKLGMHLCFKKFQGFFVDGLFDALIYLALLDENDGHHLKGLSEHFPLLDH